MPDNTVTATLTGEDYACVVDNGHHRFIIDEPLHKGGGDKGPDPFMALLASLGSCSAITLKMYAQRKGWPVEHVSVAVRLVHRMQEHHRVNVFVREVLVGGPLDQAQLARLHEIVRACPVSRILEGKIEIETVVGKYTGATPG